MFISHRSADKANARVVARHVQRSGLDVWFDEDDAELSIAAAKGDHAAITQAIQRGLHHATHALCLLSPQCVDSWWIPYELGYATRHGADLVSLMLRDTEDVPSYLRINPVFGTIGELDAWLRVVAGAGYTHPDRPAVGRTIFEAVRSFR